MYKEKEREKGGTQMKMKTRGNRWLKYGERIVTKFNEF